MFYRVFVRPLLYVLPAETAHHLVMTGMRVLAALPFVLALLRRITRARDPMLEVHALGRTLASPFGLAAGLDKNAEAYEAFGALGFGFVEIGTITAQAQPGNPRPRLFRLPPDRALVNRMGFNNCGAEDAARRFAAVATRPRHTIVGINIGKTKVTPNEQADADYAASAALLAPYADYMVINVSSPNTPGLRDLQAVETLRPLITRVQAVLAAQPQRLPLLLKIAPDLADGDIDAIAELALELRIDGIIATNTTIARSGLASDPSVVAACGAGGLSGAPLKARALAVLRRLRARVGNQVLLVAAGGVESASDAFARIRAGASLVQIYTALIYEGPGLPAQLTRDLPKLVRAAGFSRISEAIGVDVEPRSPEASG